MPLTRALSGRSKSRLAQLPQKPGATPTFFPPSHYAAAAGIQYTRPDTRRKESSSSSNHSYCGISSTDFFAAHDRSASGSYPSETESVTTSSFEVQFPNLQQDPRQNLNQTAERQRRRSLVTELPQIEAQLLPSLRDTIDRMTRSPGEPPSLDPYVGQELNATPQVSDNMTRLHSVPRSPVVAKHAGSSLKSPVPMSSPNTSRSRSASQSQHGYHTPRQGSSKPYMTSPSPMTPVGRTGTREAGESHSVASQKRLSLRSPHTKIQNKMTSPRPTPSNSGHSSASSQDQSGLASARTANFHRRTRSRSDPGIAPPSIPSTQRVRSPNNNHAFTSNIPRPWKMQRPKDDSDSDLSQRYEAKIQGQRKLIVTNATIGSPSSSDSDNVGFGFEDRTQRWSALRAMHHKPGGYGHTHVNPPPPPLRPSYPSVGENLKNGPDPSQHARSEAVERRTALYNVVTGIDDSAQPELDSDESEYMGEDGFAVSSSWNKTEGSHEETCDYQEVQTRSERRSERQQSSTRLRPSPKVPQSTKSRRIPPPAYENNFNSRQSYGSRLRTKLSDHRALPSRSPVMASGDLPSLPAALKWHSVYHRTPNPPSNHTIEANNLYTPDSPMHRLTIQGPPALATPSDPHILAVRERQAFGIPESNSEDILLGAHIMRDASRTPEESELSSESSIYIDEEEESELSAGVESLLKGLDSQAPGSSGPAHEIPSQPSPTHEYPEVERSLWENPHSPHQYATPRPIRQPSDPVQEAQRKIVEELAHNQREYVERLHLFLQLFILPLRYQNSRQWISGIPEKVCRLFDWLEDILVLHQQIWGAVDDHRQVENIDVVHLAKMLRPLISRLEVYQPYLVKHEEVVELIARSIEDRDSEFGEFMKMQGQQALSSDQNFRQFLLEPTEHLDIFYSFLSRLREVTPRSTGAYLSLLILDHSIRMAIRVLKEVQAREEEYAGIKRLGTRIRGLPQELRLAWRKRRLLHCGILSSVDTGDFHASALDCRDNASIRSSLAFPNSEYKGPGSRGSTHAGFSPISSPSSSSAPVKTNFKRISHLPSLQTPKLMKQSLLRKPSSNKVGTATTKPLRHDSRVFAFVFDDLLLLTRLDADVTERGIPTTISLGLPPRMTSAHDDDYPSLALLEELGCLWIIEVRSIAGNGENVDGSQSTLVIELDTLPADAKRANMALTTLQDVDVFPKIRTLRLSIPIEFQDSATDPPFDALQNPARRSGLHEGWMSALECCSWTCLSRLSSNSPVKTELNDTGLGPDSYPVVISLLASGLPIPKSPSLQNQHANPAGFDEGEDPETVKEGEREERGWWSLRFQQVFRELDQGHMAPLSAR